MQTGQAMVFLRMILDTLAQDIDEHPRSLLQASKSISTSDYYPSLA